jgi:hypothetical protein
MTKSNQPHSRNDLNLSAVYVSWLNVTIVDERVNVMAERWDRVLVVLVSISNVISKLIIQVLSRSPIKLQSIQ